MAERRGLLVLRVLFRVTKVSTALFLAIELLLFTIAIAATNIHSKGYAGTNLSGDAAFFGAMLSPLLALSCLALFVLSALCRWRDAPENARSYVGGMIFSGLALVIAVGGLLAGLGFAGGGIIPH